MMVICFGFTPDLGAQDLPWSLRPAASELLSLAAQVAEGGIQVGHVGSEYLWHKVVPPKRYKVVYKPHEYYRYIYHKP